MSWLGRALRGIRAGDEHLLIAHPRLAAQPRSLVLTSASFADGEAMPSRTAGRGVGGKCLATIQLARSA